MKQRCNLAALFTKSNKEDHALLTLEQEIVKVTSLKCGHHGKKSNNNEGETNVVTMKSQYLTWQEHNKIQMQTDFKEIEWKLHS